MADIEKKAYEAYPIHPSPVEAQITIKKGEDTHIDLRKGYTQALIEYESLPKIHGWLVRSENGNLILCSEKPEFVKYCPTDNSGWWYCNGIKCMLPQYSYPELMRPEDGSVEVELLIRKI